MRREGKRVTAKFLRPIVVLSLFGLTGCSGSGSAGPDTFFEEAADSICPQAIALNFDTLIKNMDLDAWRISCR